MASAIPGLPFYACGIIIKGFGRGSKQLGFPTANYSKDVVDKLPKDFATGIYFGLAQLDSENVIYKMVMSVGWNPYFKNKEKSMETYIMHKFDEDLYGRNLKVIILGYLRREKDFSDLASLINAINEDVKQAEQYLNMEKFKVYYDDSYFH